MKLPSENTLTVHLNQDKRVAYKNTCKFQESQPDLYVILGCKIYPLHKTQVIPCGLISSMIKTHEKVVILQVELEAGFFEGVIGFLYGCDLEIWRSGNLEKMYETAKTLQIPELLQIYLNDFTNNFEEYSFFELYKLALKYEIPQIVSKCQQELVALQYQQINYNRSDLLELPRQIFQKIIRNHQKLKANKQISGICARDIREVIQNYSEYNNCKIQAKDLMKVDQYDCFEEEEEKIQSKEIFQSEIFLKKTLKKKTKNSYAVFHSHSELKAKQKRMSAEHSSNEKKHQNQLNNMECFKYCLQEIQCCNFNEIEGRSSVKCIDQPEVNEPGANNNNQASISIINEEPEFSSHSQISPSSDINQNSEQILFAPERQKLFEYPQNYCSNLNNLPRMEKNFNF